MKSGSADGTDNSSVIYRGIEDIFGNIWQFVYGINVKDYQTYIGYDKSQYESDKFDGCYQPIGDINAITNAQWVSKPGYDVSNSLVMLPVETNESSTIYVSGFYVSNSGNRIVFIGGAWQFNFKAGLWYWDFSLNSSYKSVDIGARLLKTN